MKIKWILLILMECFIVHVAAQQLQQDTINPKEYAKITTDRLDQRYVSSRGIVHALLKRTVSECAFNPNFNLAEFRQWQQRLRGAMTEIMHHPQIENLPVPHLIHSEQKDGYRLEKWEAYPLPDAVVPYLVLIPDGVNENNPAPAIMCIPGSGETKETAAGQPELHPRFQEDEPYERWIIALPYVKKGLVAVVVDNPGAGEASDLERYTIAPDYQYEAVARYLLELGWSYLGYSSYVDMHILNWMKKQKFINNERIIISGFSLGTEPLMVMGALDSSIYGFIFNDFLCRTLERAIVLTEPDKYGRRPFPNSIRHLIPNFWCKFDFPDIVASFAPRPIIFTEGGLDRDLDMVQKAYQIAGKPENVDIYFYPKYADPSSRMKTDKLPEGINRRTYFNMVNVDDPQHDIKSNLTIPWLVKILNLQ